MFLFRRHNFRFEVESCHFVANLLVLIVFCLLVLLCLRCCLLWFGGLVRYFRPLVAAVGDEKRVRDSFMSAKKSVARQTPPPGCFHVMKKL